LAPDLEEEIEEDTGDNQEDEGQMQSTEKI